MGHQFSIIGSLILEKFANIKEGMVDSILKSHFMFLKKNKIKMTHNLKLDFEIHFSQGSVKMSNVLRSQDSSIFIQILFLEVQNGSNITESLP